MRRENQIKKCGQDITIVNASRILHCNALTRARTAMSQFLPKSTGSFFWPLPRSRADVWPVTPLNAMLSMTHNYLVAARPSSQNTGLT